MSGVFLSDKEYVSMNKQIRKLRKSVAYWRRLCRDFVSQQDIVNAPSLAAMREAVEAWREARKSVKLDDVFTVQSYRPERDAAVRERDAACEALRFYADGENYKYPESGDLAVLQDDGSKARAALAKIGGRG